VSDPGYVLLGQTELERAFTALGERLARRGVVADIFVVGGAAMALAYNADRATRDVDARASPEHVFAMKSLAAMTRDIDDLKLLAGMIGIETADAGLWRRGRR
jgi:hypothetical protein